MKNNKTYDSLLLNVDNYLSSPALNKRYRKHSPIDNNGTKIIFDKTSEST